ncbi:hypothetical protein [Sphingomonas sp. PAMC 26605]|uniref:hypothetical protein n=1 Tax=Sphingomonas sp. PAMC 26605 TaxID=1112214 RepID=UPI00026CD68B|nr:hypothetical protein [Sphingomonas sp. PAMC 26605]
MSDIDPRPTGPMLYSEVRSYCVRVGCSQAQFARSSGITEQTLLSIQHAAHPLERTVKRVRGFIEANPSRCPGAAKPGGGWLAPSAPKEAAALMARGYAGAAALQQARAASIAPARPSSAAIAAAEAEAAVKRRSTARMGSHRMPVPHALPVDAAPAEVLATGLVETPGDLIARVRSAWPELWAAVVKASRASGEPAGATLMRAISRGLEEISA